ncbi:glycoside hydrolase family 99-like domain-containing protein [Caballeronia sp. INML2]|uniref:glycoside hydrolase family 99-like domain-containing protein n=1 Tax=Caballeronia sp. INML2 TaxID=2921748 RepID=UPI00202885DD|nr:glycoside hydrolase family 99-like domain-containing protein [Caballeronia sp. INML2]
MTNYDLNTFGYRFNPDTRVWSRATEEPFAYSDGDEAEERVAGVIAGASDLSVMSEELLRHCTDWPSRYHLSHERANLLRPFSGKLRGRLLEIGAGCGAITRFLAEEGAEVVALEGSARRARIAASRVRDLNNATVVCDTFDDLRIDGKFDVVTLIGVLEYARKYGQGADPVQAMLERARSFIKPGGTLLIAIENQLGLKYLAGMPEDHLGKPMFGIQDLYTDDSVVTFGRHELSKRIRAAGFDTVDLALPFPDYKLPSSVVLPGGLGETNAFRPWILAVQSVKRDHQLHVIPNFSIEQAWGVVGKNDLLDDLSNSFLFLATVEGPTPLLDQATLAVHFSTGRRRPFRKSTAFERSADGRVAVKRRLLEPSLAPESGSMFKFAFADEWLEEGESFEALFLRIVTTPGWSVKQVGACLREFVDVVIDAAAKRGFVVSNRAVSTSLPGSMLDIVPFNIIRKAGGGYSIIDQEWSFEGDIELGFLAFRALAGMGHMVTRWATPADPRWLNQKVFFEQVFAHAGLLASVHDFDRYLEFESMFQSFATGVGARVTIEQWQHAIFRGELEQTHSRAQVVDAGGRLLSVNDELNTVRVLLKQREAELQQAYAQRQETEQQLANATRALDENRGTWEAGRTSQEHRERVLRETQAELAAAESNAVALEREVGTLKNTLAAATQGFEELSARYRLVTGSRSWKLTRPLRGLLLAVRDPRAALSRGKAVATPAAFRRVDNLAASSGGYPALVRYGLRILKTEGLDGVKSRVRRHVQGQPLLADAASAGAPVVPQQTPEPIDYPFVKIDADGLVHACETLRFEVHADPQVTVLVKAVGNCAQVVACLTSIRKRQQLARFNVEVLAGPAQAELAALLPESSGVRLHMASSDEASVQLNEAVASARGAFVLVLRSDVQVFGQWLDALVTRIESDASIVAVGGKVALPDGRLSEAGVLIGTNGEVRHVGFMQASNNPSYDVARDVVAVSGTIVLLRRAAFVDAAGIDTGAELDGLDLYDYFMRVGAQDKRVVYEPGSLVAYAPDAADAGAGQARDSEIAESSRSTFVSRWGERLADLTDIRLIAFLLPQYHPIPENDEWWGKGFTEWTNVAKAHPNFAGHYQPHRPADLGYYDLRLPEVRQQQADLARAAGIHGFCYYHYWFGGHRLLERPLNDVLALGEPDFPFCICWANENWTRRWDGLESAVLMAQKHSDEDDAAFIRSLLPTLRDRRYIRINGRPLIIVYRMSLLPNPRRTAQIWRDIAREAGLGELYLAYVQSFDSWARNEKPSDFDFDAAVEFPPHGCGVPSPHPVQGLDPAFKGVVYDYPLTAQQTLMKARPPYPMFRGVMPSWDNTARKQHNSHIFVNSSPEAYEAWLSQALQFTDTFAHGDERIVFINAWNEWGEGNHLEPDMKYGHAYLDATRRALNRITGQAGF